MASEGRQSPPPETQTGEQLKDAPAMDPNLESRSSDDAKDKERETLNNLESNPEHILAKSAEEKTSKKKYIH
jgi:hypothetical protein